MEKNILSFEKKLISNIKYMKNKISILDYNIMKNKISPLDEGIEPLNKPKRTRRTKHTFKLSDIKKEDVKQTGFTTKQQSIKFLNDILDKNILILKLKMN